VSAPVTNVRPYVQCLQLLLTVWAGRVTINILPDDVLLLIFLCDREPESRDSYSPYVSQYSMKYQARRGWRWYRLVHVCRRWRSVVFASPNFLDLKLVCGSRTRAGLTGIWPTLPIIIRNMIDSTMPEDYDLDAIMVHRDRVCEIDLLHLSRPIFQRLVSAMQEQFPALIHLLLECHCPAPAPAIPDGFLGGSAPHLQSLGFHSISFPALPKLLLSATDLVRLDLLDIPHSGYMSPEAIVTSLAVLANLKSLIIELKSPLSRPKRESRRPPPPTRTALPALTMF
jgi:hypothetical protein